MNACRLAALGCGTVNHHNVEALFNDPTVAAAVTAFDTVDYQTVSQRNGLTVPWLRGHEGESKAVCLRDRAMALSGRPLAGAAHDQYVETVDGSRLLAGRPRDASAGRMVFVLIGLDCWSSRVSAVSDLRHAAAAAHGELLIVQAAVDCGQAQVSIFGPRWQDACPACGLLALPAAEPCVVLREGGRLLRGDLRCEAAAAAAEVLAVVKHCLAHGTTSRWRNLKINLMSAGAGGEFARFVRARPMVSGCWGPHSPHTPLRLEELLAE